MPPTTSPGTLPRLPQIPARGASPCIANSCSACCHDTEMLLTEDDVLRLRAARPGVDFHFTTEDGFLQLRTRDGPAAPGMKGRPCIFLDSAGLCSVHAARPEGCRLFPAVWDGEHQAVILDKDYCPHTEDFLLPQATIDAVRRLATRLHSERDARSDD